MRRHRVAGICVAILTAGVVTSCGVQQSNIDPSATVTISGKALASDGHPLTNTRVVLVRELDFGQAIGGLFLTAATLGISCLADRPPAVCANNAHVATTDGSGSYSFAVKGSDTQGSIGLAGTIEVMTRASALSGEISGPVALAEFTVQTTSLTLPDLRIWQPTVKPAGKSAGEKSSWPQLPAAYGSSPTYALEFSDLHGNPWWVTGATSPGNWVDDRVLEDLNGAFDVAARVHDTAPGTTVDFTYISGSVPIRGNAGRPPSRGAQCAPVTAGGVGSFVSGCFLTSGDLGRHPQQFAGATEAVIDLSQESALTLAVVRGCRVQCRVALSDDLSSWSDAGTLSGYYATAPITLNRSARYVRIAGPPADLRQISIW